MSTKQFLPMTRFDVIDSDSAVNYDKGASLKCKIVPLLGIFAIIFGGTVLGYSILTVGDLQIGYYANEDGYYESGLYLRAPWNKEEFIIESIGPQTLTLSDIKGSTRDDYYYYADSIEVTYEISDVQNYIKNVRQKNNFKIKLTRFILDEIRAELDKVSISDIRNTTRLSNEEPLNNAFGVRIIDIEFGYYYAEHIGES
jgi:hypothetical protein